MVSDVSIKDIEELMGIRKVLEEYALDFQAFDNMTEADLLQLEVFIQSVEVPPGEKRYRCCLRAQHQNSTIISLKKAAIRGSRLFWAV